MTRLDSVSSTRAAEINHQQISSQTSVCWGRFFQILTAPFFCCKKNSHADLQSNNAVPHPQNHVHWEDGQTGLEDTPDPESQRKMNGHHSDGMRLRNGRQLHGYDFDPSRYM